MANQSPNPGQSPLPAQPLPRLIAPAFSTNSRTIAAGEVGAELCPVSSKPQAVQNGCRWGSGSWRQTSITAPARWPLLQRLDQVGIDHRHAAPGIDEQRRGWKHLNSAASYRSWVAGVSGSRLST